MVKEFANREKKTPKNRYAMAVVRKSARQPAQTNANGDLGAIEVTASPPQFAAQEKLKWTPWAKIVATAESNIDPVSAPTMVVLGGIGATTAHAKTKGSAKSEILKRPAFTLR